MIVIVSNTTWSLVNFRMGLIGALKQADYSVVCVSPADGYEKVLLDNDVQHIHWDLAPRSLNPLRELASLWSLYRHLNGLNVTAILAFTIKPNIYTSIVGRLLGVQVCANVTGFGDGFSSDSRSWSIKSVLTGLYLKALSHADHIFAQNDRDFALLERVMRSYAGPAVHCLPGSGVDLLRFPFAVPPSRRECFRVLFVGRLFWSNGQTRRDHL